VTCPNPLLFTLSPSRSLCRNLYGSNERYSHALCLRLPESFERRTGRDSLHSAVCMKVQLASASGGLRILPAPRRESASPKKLRLSRRALRLPAHEVATGKPRQARSATPRTRLKSSVKNSRTRVPSKKLMIQRKEAQPKAGLWEGIPIISR
jgi:hypothetical protein